METQTKLEYVKNSLASGKSKDDIYKELLIAGSSVDDIEALFRHLQSEDSKDETQKKTIGIVVVIAAILIAAGIFSFIASNWRGMGSVLKVAIIVFFMLLSYFSGWIVRERTDYKKTGGALLFLGSIIYGAGIFLLGQIFNIRVNWPDGFILWMIGTMIMAYAIESFATLYLAILVGFVAIFGYPFEFFDRFGGDRFLMTSTFLLIVSTAITFVAANIINKKYKQIN